MELLVIYLIMLFYSFIRSASCVSDFVNVQYQTTLYHQEFQVETVHLEIFENFATWGSFFSSYSFQYWMGYI